MSVDLLNELNRKTLINGVLNKNTCVTASLQSFQEGKAKIMVMKKNLCTLTTYTSLLKTLYIMCVL